MTDLFIQNIRNIAKESIAAPVYYQARRCLLDYLAVTLAGSRTFGEKEKKYLEATGTLSGEAAVLGHGRSAVQTAALLNGMSSHVIELDDGHRRGALHVGGPVFSALLAVAEREKISGKDLLYGAIIGYEATIRLACAVQPGNKLRGYHATGTCGTVGAAVGIAAALGFDADQMKSALSAAVASSAGVLEMQEDNSDLKPLNVGRAAMDAVAAAYIGKAGFMAPKDALGGKRGFLKVMTDDPEPSFLTDFKQDEALAITQVYMKTYAACRHTHPAIEAALKLRECYTIPVDGIERVKVDAYKLAVAGHDHKDILGISSAKMSMPFSVALALSVGSAGMQDYNDKNVSDKDILALTQKVDIVEDAALTALVPEKRASIVNVLMKDGRTLVQRVDYPKGEPENPLTDGELIEKFKSLASVAGISQQNAGEIVDMVLHGDFGADELINSLIL